MWKFSRCIINQGVPSCEKKIAYLANWRNYILDVWAQKICNSVNFCQWFDRFTLITQSCWFQMTKLSLFLGNGFCNFSIRISWAPCNLELTLVRIISTLPTSNIEVFTTNTSCKLINWRYSILCGVFETRHSRCQRISILQSNPLDMEDFEMMSYFSIRHVWITRIILSVYEMLYFYSLYISSFVDVYDVFNYGVTRVDLCNISGVIESQNEGGTSVGLTRIVDFFRFWGRICLKRNIIGEANRVGMSLWQITW